MKKTLLLLFAMTLFLTGSVFAQKTISNSYVFTSGTGTYGGDLGLSYTTIIGANQDNATSGLRPLPFTFNFLGQSFTQFSATSNGLISLGSTPLTGNETSNAMAASVPGIKIAPYWDDLSTGTNGYVKYAYYGGTFYINFRLTIPNNPGGAANADIQVRLTASGGISFYYGSTAAPFPSFQSIPTNAGGYSIGIGSSSTDFASVTMTGVNTSTCAFGTANDANTQSITGPFGVYFTPDNTLPVISTQTIPNSPGTDNRILVKTITDAGKGIPTSGSLVPRIYYNKNNGTYVSTPGVLTSGTSANGTWTFTVDHALLGGVVQGDVIYYYVAAQDQAFNTASNPAGVVATDVNTITTPPASPSSYVIPMDFSGIVTVGTGGDYPSLTNSGGLFEQLNAGNVVGNVTVNILSDLTSETGSIALSAWTEGPGGPFTVTVSPSGARTVSGASAANGLIYLNGAHDFIIDGLNAGGNSLTIANTSASYPALNIAFGANNNTITNTTLTANGGSVVKFGTASTVSINNNNTISNNIITSGTTVPTNGISFGGSTSVDSYDNVVDNNKIINFTISGINLSNGYINTTISNNEIYNDIPSGTSLSGISVGAYYGAGIINVVGNYIHDLNPASAAGTGTINGINYTQSSYSGPYDILNIHNNVISLDATLSNTNITLNGIWLGGGAGSYVALVNVYYNSIYIGGTGIVAGTSAGLKIGGGNYYSSNTVKNNAIYNARSGGSGKHYGVSYYYSNNLISDFNNIYVSGTNGVFGYYLNADYTDLAAWRAVSGQDYYSFSGDPGFTSPTNLLPDPLNPNSAILDNHGMPLPTVSTDILGNTRSTSLPTLTDIGAYENANTSSADIFRPIISFTPLPDGDPTTIQTLSATITDGIGIASGANLPRIYYKKSSDANVFLGNTSSDNGWKYTQATNWTSPYDFTIDYAIINGGSVSPGDAIQYFVIAQDEAGNHTSQAPGAEATTPDPVQNVAVAPESYALNFYIIVDNNISGTKNIPGDYPNLTGSAGLFDMMNKGTVTGNINVLITDNLVEPGTVALNEFAAPFTLTIAPGDATLKTISGNADEGLIRFNGADRVIVDGRFSGSGKYLEFHNSSTATSSQTTTFMFYNGATSNTIQYAIVKGQSPLNGAVFKFHGIGVYGGANSNNKIDYCDISNPGPGESNAIYSYSNTGGSNVSNTISNCNISDFSTFGLNLSVGNSDWTIMGNSFFQTTQRIVIGDINVIIITSGSNYVISGNYIGGSAPMAAGTPWAYTSGNNYFRGIYGYNGFTNFTITNNTITNIHRTSSGGNGFYGISLSTGSGTVSGNIIGSINSANAIVLNVGANSTTYGIYKIGTGTPILFSNNQIGGFTLTAPTTFTHSFIGISCSGAGLTFTGNTIGSTTVENSVNAANPSTSTSAQQVIGINASLTGTNFLTDNIIANLTNNYAGTSTSGFVKGLAPAGAGSWTITGNTVFNLKNNSPMAGTLGISSVVGIADASTSTSKTISKNMVYNLVNTSGNQGVSIIGMLAGGGSATYSNNVINMGRDIAGSDITTGYSINGIYNQTGSNSYYFNTINISGTGVSGTTASTYALYCAVAVANIRDNITVNTRTGGTGGQHYALRISSSPATLDYNNYFTSGGTGFLNALATTDYNDFATWKSTAVSGKDLASLNVDPVFTSATNLVPTNVALVAGLPIAGITEDITGTTRAATPTIGAYEANACSNPTAGGTIETDQTGCDPFDPLIITSSAAASGSSGTLEYKWQMSVTNNTTGFTDIASSNSETYNPGELTQTTWFKRLARVDCKADWTGAAHSNVVEMTVNPLPEVTSVNAVTICSGISPVIALEATLESNFIWAVGTVTGNITGATGGSGTLIDEILTNNGTTAGSVEYIVTPTSVAGSCEGPDYTITVTVNPLIPVSVQIFATQNPVCIGNTVQFFATPSTTTSGAALTFQWKVNGSNVGLNANNYSYIPADGDVVTCELSTDIACPNVNLAVSNVINMTVNPLPALNPITGEAITCAGTLAVAYGVTIDNSATASYEWSYSGLGATLSATAGSSITIDFANDATTGTLTVVETINGCSTENTQTITVNQCLKTLNLTLFFEGLYIGGGMMNSAIEFTGGIPGPKWGATIADIFTVELHDATNYSILEHTVNNVELHTDGTAVIALPGNLNGDYYLTIRHRNSILTVSATPVSFALGTVSYDFSDAITKSFGSNQRSMGDGVYAIWVGDVTSAINGYPGDPISDGVIDLEDLYYLNSSYLASDLGYKPGDINGDGVVDIDDIYMCYNNYLLGIYTITP